jgi:hypothetical protein
MKLRNTTPKRTSQWAVASVGTAVAVSKQDRVLCVGVIDDVTEDGSCVWVLPQGGQRFLLHVDDGYELTEAGA